VDLYYCVCAFYRPAAVGGQFGVESKKDRGSGCVEITDDFWYLLIICSEAAIFAPLFLRDDMSSYPPISPIGKRNFLLYFIN
jgi:hypothetical protein